MFWAEIQLCVNISDVLVKKRKKKKWEKSGKRSIGENALHPLTFVAPRRFMNGEMRNKRGRLDGGSFADIPSTLNNLSEWTLKKKRTLSHLCTNLLKGLADLPISLYWGSNGKRHSLCLGAFIKFIGLTCYF